MSEEPKVMHYRSTATPANRSDQSHVVQALVDRHGFGSETLSICECGRFMVPVELHNITPSMCPICKTERKLRWIYPRLPKKDLPEDALVVDTEKSAEWLQDVLDCWGQMRVAWAQNAEVVEKLDRAIEKVKSGFDNLPSVVMDSIPTIVHPTNAWKKARDEAIQIAERSYLRESGFYATEPGGKILHELLYWLSDLTDEAYQLYHHEPDPYPYPDYPERSYDPRMIGLFMVKGLFPGHSFVHNWIIEQIVSRHVSIGMVKTRKRVLRHCAQLQPIPGSPHYDRMVGEDRTVLSKLLDSSPDIIGGFSIYLQTFNSWLMNRQTSLDGRVTVFHDDGTTSRQLVGNGPFLPMGMDASIYLPEIEKELRALRTIQEDFQTNFVHQWCKMAIDCWERQKAYLEKPDDQEEV